MDATIPSPLDPRPTISVLTPDAERFHQAERRPLAPRSRPIDGARIGYIDNKFASIAVLDDEFARLLASRGATSIVVRKRSFGHPLESAQMQGLVDGADFVISGLCSSAPSTAWGAHDSAELERSGIPTVTLATAHYEELLTETATAEGMPDLRRIILPHPFEGRSESEIRAIAGNALGPLVAALTDPNGPTTMSVAER